MLGSSRLVRRAPQGGLLQARNLYLSVSHTQVLRTRPRTVVSHPMHSSPSPRFFAQVWRCIRSVVDPGLIVVGRCCRDRQSNSFPPGENGGHCGDGVSVRAQGRGSSQRSREGDEVRPAACSLLLFLVALSARPIHRDEPVVSGDQSRLSSGTSNASNFWCRGLDHHSRTTFALVKNLLFPTHVLTFLKR